jgi:hypothetical protein
MIPTLPIQITCPSCKTKYTAQVQSIVDVGENPQLKAALLRGQLNVVVCPSCHISGMVSAPLLYHDPQKELLLLFIPPELNIPLAERERLTGSLVNALMTAIPAEQRKGYFLNPRTALTMQGLLDEILKADGVTPEMLEKQRARSRLLQDLLRAMDDEAQLQALVDQHKADIDYQFFLTLAATAENSAMAGQQQVMEKLLKLRDTLLARTSVVLPEPLPLDTPPGQVLDRVLALKEHEGRWAFAMYNRPLLDYAFFQELTSRIEKATPAEVDALRMLRTELLEMTEQLDKEAQAVQEAKIKLLQDVLASPDPAQTLRDRQQEIDSLFLAILGSALRNAQRGGKAEEVQQLQKVSEITTQILQDSLPPELRLVNNLLSADYPEGTRKMLEERRQEWDAEFLEILTALASDVEEQGRPEAAQRLKDIRVQAELLLGSPGAPASTPAPPAQSPTN